MQVIQLLMLEEGYSPGQDSSSVSSDESQAEPTIHTGGGFGKGPAILTARWFAIQHKHRLASVHQHPYFSMANGMHAHPSSWHFTLFT